MAHSEEWKTRHRFFVEQGRLSVGDPVALDGLAHQLHAVLRLAPGAYVTLLDGRGGEFLAQLQRLDNRRATAVVLDVRTAPGEPAVHLTLFACTLKQDRFEWVLQKGTELGVACFVPVVAARSVVRPVEALTRKYGRWRAIVREAAEQSGRGRLPELAEPVDFTTAVFRCSGQGFVLWEEASVKPSLVSTLLANTAQERFTRCSLLVGPEGGMTRQEVALAQDAGWQPVTLGPRILRAETAAVAAVSIVMAATGQLGEIPVLAPTERNG